MVDMTNYKLLVSEGAILLDVRSEGEFSAGHIEGAVNIPLEELGFRFDELADKLVITCCRSGNRSEMALHILGENGIDAINGGPWDLLREKIK